MLRRMMGKEIRGTFVVVTYHAVKPRHVAKLAVQLDLLLRTSTIVAAGQKLPLPTGKHCVAVTFDDGYHNFIKHALPVILEKRIPATVFVPAGNLGALPGWIKSDGHDNSMERIMTRDELRNLPRDVCTVGSHGMYHTRLSAQRTDEIKYELHASKQALEELLHVPVELLSFPHNDYDEQCVTLAREAGYRRVFANVPLPLCGSNDAFLLGRIEVSPDDWNLEFSLKVQGAYAWLPYAIILKRWILSLLPVARKGTRTTPAGVRR